MVQCTPDIVSSECRICLAACVSEIRKYCNGKEGGRVSKPSCNISLNSKKPEAVSHVSAPSPAADPCPQHSYLLELGMDLEQIKLATCKYPSFANYSSERKIKPLVEFLLDLGVAKSDIPKILVQRPHLCGHSISGLLSLSRQKVQAVVNFLLELGLSGDSIGKVLTRYPRTVSYNVEDNLRPTAKYFKSLGVNVAIVVHRCPASLWLSIEGNLKPVTKFFYERRFSVEDIGTMLVKFPQYFSYSLEQRIRPRFVLVKELGLTIGLDCMLVRSDCGFEKVLEMKRKNMLADELSSPTESK
ncbi:hypothetical protein Pint_26819 [Pistacia integerrima]|uniref:Uncharacterized protein n=1 Tax=Pistacia integerrima TaxID=434235 RepID=A0ACC0YQL3_9ROSI|nr:hypothetical protein Pint_26819 [Pistacia integerrima]